MSYFEKEENVRRYLEIAEGYDGRELIEVFKKYLPAGSSVLELGMGPGKDLDIMGKVYRVTGSDISSVFIDMYRERNPEADLLRLDAVDIKTERTFDALYTNKALVHLTIEELTRSIARQAEVLTAGGIIFHSFWKGEGSKKYDGLHFQYYEKEELEKLFSPFFKIHEITVYTEMEKDDSLVLVAEKAKVTSQK